MSKKINIYLTEKPNPKKKYDYIWTGVRASKHGGHGEEEDGQKSSASKSAGQVGSFLGSKKQKLELLSTVPVYQKAFENLIKKSRDFYRSGRSRATDYSGDTPIDFEKLPEEIMGLALQDNGKDRFDSNTHSGTSSLTDRSNIIDWGANLSRSYLKIENLLIDLTGLEKLDFKPGLDTVFTNFVQGLFLGGYDFDKYKQSKEESGVNKKKKKEAVSITLLMDSKLSKQLKAAAVIKEQEIVALGVAHARDLVNEPPNVLDTDTYTAWVKKQIREQTKEKIKGAGNTTSIRFTVHQQEQLKKMKMNTILAVNSGSKKEAKLLEMVHTPKKFNAKKDKTVLLVGKGVTFDSGGLSLKPSKAMEDMKMDMAGSAAVISAFLTIAKLNINVRVVALTPLTDNMTGGDAVKVGDIIETYSGKTVEVLNTDAEGRLILADALAYGVKKYPETHYMIDLATLTGACLVALGVYYAGLFSNSKELSELLMSSAEQSGERLWPLPLDGFFLNELESSVADLKNIGSPYGGAITAAKFLEQFIKNPSDKKGSKTPDIKWAHLDIAPTMLVNATKGQYAKGATGFGVRLLVDFVKQLELQ